MSKGNIKSRLNTGKPKVSEKYKIRNLEKNSVEMIVIDNTDI